MFPTLQVTVRMFVYVRSYHAVTLLDYLGQSVAILDMYPIFTPVLYSSLSSPVNYHTQLNCIGENLMVQSTVFVGSVLLVQ